MKNHFSTVRKLVAAAVCALSLGSCSRAEYAMLPKGASYHGVSRVATPVPAPLTVATIAPHASEAAPVAKAASAKPIVAEAQPVAAATNVASAAAVTSTSAAAPAKLNLLQRVALNKVSKKLEKVYRKTSVNRHENAASTARLDGKLRQGLILLIVGLLVGIVAGAVGGSIGYIIGILGLILAIIGIVLIILYLLDEL